MAVSQDSDQICQRHPRHRRLALAPRTWMCLGRISGILSCTLGCRIALSAQNWRLWMPIGPYRGRLSAAIIGSQVIACMLIYSASARQPLFATLFFYSIFTVSYFPHINHISTPTAPAAERYMPSHLSTNPSTQTDTRSESFIWIRLRTMALFLAHLSK